MTQVKCTRQLPRGLSPAAIKYAERVALSRESFNLRAKAREAENKRATLPKGGDASLAKKAFLAAVENALIEGKANDDA